VAEGVRFGTLLSALPAAGSDGEARPFPPRLNVPSSAATSRKCTVSRAGLKCGHLRKPLTPISPDCRGLSWRGSVLLEPDGPDQRPNHIGISPVGC